MSRRAWPTSRDQPTGLPELVALGPQGLLAYLTSSGNASGSLAWESLPTLSDLAYPSSQWSSDPGKAASLMAADIDGQGYDEVLALQDGALQAWSFDIPRQAWTRLQPTTPLALSDTSVWNHGRVALFDVPGVAMSTATVART